MDVIIHKRIELLDEIVPIWGKLTSEFREVTIFQDIEWMKDWWEQKKKSKEITPYIVEIREENKTIGIIPLYLSDKEFANIRFRILRPIGIGDSNYLLPILSKDYLPEKLLKKAMDKIYENKKDWDCIHWGDLPEGSIFDSFLKGQTIGLNHKWIIRRRINISPRVILNRDIELVKSKFSKVFFKGILYKERKLKKEGYLHYHVVKEEIDIIPIMKKLFDFHCERWRSTDTPSKFRIPEERELMLNKVRSLFKRGLLHLCYLSHNEEIAAVELGMIDQKTRNIYIRGTNPKFNKYSVGQIIIYKMIEEACAKGYEVMDFLRGDEEYKQKWGSINAVNLEYLLFNSSIKSLLFMLVNNTYYTRQFLPTSPIKQLLMKSVIRGFTFLIRIKDRFGQKSKIHNGVLMIGGLNLFSKLFQNIFVLLN